MSFWTFITTAKCRRKFPPTCVLQVRKMVKKLNEIFSLVIKCRWNFRRHWSSRCWISIEIHLQHKTIPCQTEQLIFCQPVLKYGKNRGFFALHLDYLIVFNTGECKLMTCNLFQNTFKNENICLIQLKFSREG